MNPKITEKHLDHLIRKFMAEKKVAYDEITARDLQAYVNNIAEDHITRGDLKKIDKYFEEHDGSVYMSDIAEKLEMDMRTVVTGCKKLMRAKLIGVVSLKEKE